MARMHLYFRVCPFSSAVFVCALSEGFAIKYEYDSYVVLTVSFSGNRCYCKRCTAAKLYNISSTLPIQLVHSCFCTVRRFRQDVRHELFLQCPLAAFSACQAVLSKAVKASSFRGILRTTARRLCLSRTSWVMVSNSQWSSSQV